ncbi:MAG: type VI secretion system baseplate subunit TssG [Chitinivibrionales bacterium]|nr:type VI secretion system baseplate subunit TssG [Chitinivibrionales bacterium]
MGFAGRQTMADLIARLVRESHTINFFQAVSLLEEKFRKEGIPNPIDIGRIRFEPDSAITFPPNDIAAIEELEGAVRFILSFMGLIGISSPLPIYFSEYVIKHKKNGIALKDFLAIFNHRVYALFYRAWKKYCFIKSFNKSGTDPFTQKVCSLAGIDTGQNNDSMRLRTLAYAGLLAGRCRGSAGLATMLSHYFDGIPVEVETFRAQWKDVPDPATVGVDMQLGLNSLAGTRVLDIGGKFRVKVGPLSRKRYEQFLPGSDSIARMQELTKAYLADPLTFDIEVKLQSSELIPVVLGETKAMLGTTSSLARTQGMSDVQSIVIGG